MPAKPMNDSAAGTKEGLHTQLCTILDIQYPIIQAGMAGGITTPELVASTSNAGGLGVLGAARLTPEQTREQIRKIKSLTSRPFGVNLQLAPPEPNRQEVRKVQPLLDKFRQELGIARPEKAGEITTSPSSRLAEQVGIIFEEKVPVLSFGLGDSARFAGEAHSVGAKVMTMATTVNEAKQVEEGGADIIVAQGSEAGGHRSTFRLDEDIQLVGTMALVPQVVDSVQVPVVAAGGIMDGRGIAACLALGAQGAMLGTRFLAAKESGIFQAYKQRLLHATEADTIVTRAFTGRPARCIKNRFADEFENSGVEPLAWPLQGIAADDIYKAAWAGNNADYFPLLAGQGLRLLRQESGASAIVEDLARETRECILQMKQLVG
jgi:nitronate monooxygenase